MPVRSLDSSVIKWPTKDEVEKALREWTHKLDQNRSDLFAVSYFGSYGKGEWGVGSDLDLMIILKEVQQPFERRPVQFDTTELPVPTDLLVYSRCEWDKKKEENDPFYEKIAGEIVWLKR